MLIYLSLIFLVFAIVIFMRHKFNTSTKVLIGSIVGWGIAIIGLICYLSYLNHYWPSVDRIFYMTSEIWNWMMLHLDISPDVFIRMMNIGINTVFYFNLIFSILFTNKNKRVKKKYYILLAIIPCVQIILYDPIVQKILQEYVANHTHNGFEQYNQVMIVCNKFFAKSNTIYYVIAVGKIFVFYFRYPKIKFLKQYTLKHILVITPIISIFYWIFKWYPISCVKTTVISGYYNYIAPPLHINFMLQEGIYLATIVALIMTLLCLYYYHSIEEYYQYNSRHINRSIDTATLGVNIFTHAIKNHVQGIKLETQYIKKLAKDNSEIQESVDLILQSCEECFQKIHNANRQLEKIELELTMQSVKEIIKEAIEVCCCKEKRDILYMPEAELHAYIDPLQFKEVIINLVQNAQDAVRGQEDGQIDIVTREQAGWIQIEVRDNGKGISKEHMNNIFNPFFSTKSSVNNWGVGLAFCYRIVSAHDGKINVESEEGKGTCFTITLPHI